MLCFSRAFQNLLPAFAALFPHAVEKSEISLVDCIQFRVILGDVD